jgi:hypothetical protein
MAQRDLSLKFVCPICEAKPQELCHMRIGVICFESHWERREIAKNLPPSEYPFPDMPHLSMRWLAS